MAANAPFLTLTAGWPCQLTHVTFSARSNQISTSFRFVQHFNAQVAPEGGEEVDKRALLDRLKCCGLAENTSAEDRVNVDYMVKHRVCGSPGMTPLAQSPALILYTAGSLCTLLSGDGFF